MSSLEFSSLDKTKSNTSSNDREAVEIRNSLEINGETLINDSNIKSKPEEEENAPSEVSAPSQTTRISTKAPDYKVTFDVSGSNKSREDAGSCDLTGPVGDIQPSNSFLVKLFGSAQSMNINKLENQMLNKFPLNKYVVHPETTSRHAWDTMAILLVTYTVFVLPARTAFLWEFFEAQGESGKGPSWDGWMVMDLCIDLFFMGDIVLNFFTGFYKSADEDYVVMHWPTIARHYCGGWLVLDIVASAPLDLLVLGGGTSSLWRLPRVLKILRLSRLLRLLRLSRMLRYLERFKIQEWLNISDFQIRIMKLICVVITFLHWNACIQWLVVVALDYPPDSWAFLSGLQHKSISVKYSWSVFRALSHMLAIGYGQEPPYTLVEAWVVSVSMVLGCSLFAVFVGIITTLLIQLDSGSALYAHKMYQVNQYMKHQSLPLKLRERIRESYEYRSQSHAFNEETMLAELPISLRTDVAMFNCRELLESVPFFIDCEPGFISSIVTLLSPSIFMTGDTIMRLGEVPTHMYFIRQGEVQVTLNGERVTYLGEGSYFGEVALVLNRHRSADVTTVRDCELYSLSKENFQKVFTAFPEVMQALQRIAEHRLSALEQQKAMMGVRQSMDVNRAQSRLTKMLSFGMERQMVHRRISGATIGNWREQRNNRMGSGTMRTIFGSKRKSNTSDLGRNYSNSNSSDRFSVLPTILDMSVRNPRGIENRNNVVGEEFQEHEKFPGSESRRASYSGTKTDASEHSRVTRKSQ